MLVPIPEAIDDRDCQDRVAENEHLHGEEIFLHEFQGQIVAATSWPSWALNNLTAITQRMCVPFMYRGQIQKW
jgi:hypothetical protein